MTLVSPPVPPAAHDADRPPAPTGTTPVVAAPSPAPEVAAPVVAAPVVAAPVVAAPTAAVGGHRTPVQAEYVLPLRRTGADGDDLVDLAAYLRSLVEVVDVTVLDGSEASVRARHREAFPAAVRLVEPDGPACRNGKVRGVLTGVRAARHDQVVLADDDVRHTPDTLRAVVDLLDEADVVRPQNVFDPLPWHARWDTARSLVARALGSDWPGTLGVRRDLLLACGGYDGDVLFENLELVRTIRAAGGRERRADDVFVTRVPPTARHFASQRVRQAYDEFARPGRLAVEAAVLPLVAFSGRRRLVVLVVASLVAVLAEVGRRRGRGRSAFPATSALWAPLWAAERAVCVWAAIGSRLLGGVPYAGSRLARAATPTRVLRRRLADVREGRRARPAEGAS